MPQGSYVWYGKSRSGKSISCTTLALAAARGRPFVRAPCSTKHAVLYVSFEENTDFIVKRIDKIAPDLGQADGVDLQVIGADRNPLPVDAGGIDFVREWANSHPGKPKLVIIDTLERFRTETRRGNAYQEDVRALSPIHELTQTIDGLTLVLLHHTNKNRDATGDDAISGSTGIKSSVDGTIETRRSASLNEDGSGRNVTLVFKSRKMEDEVQLFGCLVDNGIAARSEDAQHAELAELSDDARRIYEVLERSGEPMSPASIFQEAGVLNTKPSYDALYKLKKKGLVGKAGKYGQWAHASAIPSRQVDGPARATADQPAVAFAAPKMSPPAGPGNSQALQQGLATHTFSADPNRFDTAVAFVERACFVPPPCWDRERIDRTKVEQALRDIESADAAKAGAFRAQLGLMHLPSPPATTPGAPPQLH